MAKAFKCWSKCTPNLAKALGLAAITTCVVFWMPQGGDQVGSIDFLQYWSAARLVLASKDPYLIEHLLTLQESVWQGGRIPRPVVMWNPPVVLAPILPLGFLEFYLASKIWMILGLLLCMSCTWQLAQTYFGSTLKQRPARLLVFALAGSFLPFYTSIFFGQISPLLLFGLSLYLILIGATNERSDSIAAGAALSLTLIKPHLLYLIYLHLFLRGLYERRLRTLVGIVLGFLTLSILALIIRPAVWAEYYQASLSPPINWITPTLGSWIQGLTGLHTPWVRFLPTFLVGALSVVWFHRRGRSLDHSSVLFVLLPLSLLSSPYGWLYDQMLLLPLLLALLAKAFRSDSHRSFWALLLISINVAACLVPLDVGQQAFVWYPAVLCLLACFGFFWRFPSSASKIFGKFGGYG